jgi:hypothetical protein
MIVALCCSLFFLPVSNALAVEVPASNITLSTPTEVPGMTLQPGTYSIRVVGKLTDRVILKVDDDRGNKSVDFLGILVESAHQRHNVFARMGRSRNLLHD